MSEHDEQRPLTRRELRLREMGETGALDLSEVAEAPAEPEAPAPIEDVVAPPVNEEIEISPVNEDGTPRSRREMRQLREEALAARAAAQPAASDTDESAPVPEASTAEADSEADVDAPAVEAEPESAVTDAGETEAGEPAVEDVPAAPLTGEMDFDSLISPPTEPFTVDELREAEAERSSEDPAEAPEADEQPSESETSEPGGAEEVIAEPKAKRRFPWQRRGAEAEDETAPEGEAEDEGDSADAADPELTEAAEAEDSAAPADAELADPAPAEAVEDLPMAPSAEEPGDEAPEADAAEEVVPEPVAAKPSYSFPDIAPPEEWRSVFDDPATRSMPAQGGDAQGGFDDLISRAVAQEGAVGATNTSALILPSMPEETTGGLTGPLGGTGDLYVTGSLKLPKSLGETGGHSSLHDSIEIDPITGAETSDPQTTGHGPAPVSARHAVSARVDSTIPVVAKPAKEHSKLPLILSLTGGGLLLAVVALGIWGASNGMFG